MLLEPGFGVRDVVQIIAFLGGGITVIATTKQVVKDLGLRLDSLARQVEKLAEKNVEFTMTAVQVGTLKERAFVMGEDINAIHREISGINSQLTLIKVGGSDHLGETIRDLNDVKSAIQLLKVQGCEICHRLFDEAIKKH